MVKRWLKRLLIFLGIIASLLVVFLLFLHTSAGRSFVRQKLENFLEKKWGTDVYIGAVDYRLPNWVRLDDVVIPDQNGDTILKSRRLYVSVRMLKLSAILCLRICTRPSNSPI